MKRKRIMALLLSAVMVAGTLAGCGGSGDSGSNTSDNGSSAAKEEAGSSSSDDAAGASDTSGDSQEAAALDAIYPKDENGYPDLQGETISIWFSMTSTNAQNTSDMGEYEAIKELEKKFNCNFEFVHPPIGQAQDNFTIMMADTELPDMIFCGGVDSYYPGGVEMAYEDGILYDYTDKINAVDTPNFYNMISNDEFLEKLVTDDEGRIIRLGAKICGSEEADLIRKDYLEATGLDVPETIDEWTEMLAAMKANGVEYPLALTDGNKLMSTNIFSGAYGLSGGKGNNGFFVKEDGSVAFAPYEENYKDYLELVNSWYEAGYINPDFTTQNDDAIMSMAADDRVGSVILHLWTYGATYYVTTETQDESKALIPAPVPVLNKGDKRNLRPSGRSLGDYKYITADAKNPDACIALLDALYLEDIDRMLANGIEGVGYNMEDGYPVQVPLEPDTPKEVHLASCPQQWHTYEDTDLNYILTYKYNKGSQPDSLKLWKEEGTDGTLSNFLLYNTEESQTRQSYQADINTYVEEMFLKFMMGVEPLENFEDFRATLKEMHIEELIATSQAAMDRYESR